MERGSEWGAERGESRRLRLRGRALALLACYRVLRHDARPSTARWAGMGVGAACGRGWGCARCGGRSDQLAQRRISALSHLSANDFFFYRFQNCYCTHWLFIHLITRRFLWARDTRRHRASSPSAQPGAQTMPLLPLRIEVRPAQERSSATGAGVANPISLVTSCPKLDVTVPTKARVEASSNICTTCACVCARVSLRAHVWCESKVRATHARTRPATCPRQARRPPASSSQPPE